MPLTTMLLADRARHGARALPSLSRLTTPYNASTAQRTADDKELRLRRHGCARGAATESGRTRTGTTSDEDAKPDTYGALPASPGGQQEALSKEALAAEDAVAQATPSPGAAVEGERVDVGVRAVCAGARARECRPLRALPRRRRMRCALQYVEPTAPLRSHR